MSILSKFIAAKATAKVVEKLNARARATPTRDNPVPKYTAPNQEYIPAGQSVPARRSGTAIVDKATDFYRKNPKLVAGVGVAVAAAVLQQLTRKKSLY